MLSVIILNVVMSSVVMLNIVMLSVVAPRPCLQIPDWPEMSDGAMTISRFHDIQRNGLFAVIMQSAVWLNVVAPLNPNETKIGDCLAITKETRQKDYLFWCLVFWSRKHLNERQLVNKQSAKRHLLTL
jgi:hypothetical protein